MITLNNVSKVYPGQPAPVLDQVSLSIEKGEIFGIVGRSGAGKSTLLRTLNWLAPPTSGDIVIDGESYQALSVAELRAKRHQIGMVFQHFNLLESRTVAQNIALPLELQKKPKALISARIKELLDFVELSDFANKKPSQLSGGQKQRVAIARALAAQPKLLLCDEATSALDPETTQTILALLKKINRTLRITIVLITHEMDVVKKVCDRVGVMAQGQLIEYGRVVDVFAEPKNIETKRLVQHNLHLELPEPIQAKLHPEPTEGLFPIVRLAFIGESAKLPITTTLHEKFNVAVNILQADLEWLDDTSAGFMVCQLQGTLEQTQCAIEFLGAQRIKMEVVGYVA